MKNDITCLINPKYIIGIYLSYQRDCNWIVRRKMKDFKRTTKFPYFEIVEEWKWCEKDYPNNIFDTAEEAIEYESTELKYDSLECKLYVKPAIDIISVNNTKSRKCFDTNEDMMTFVGEIQKIYDGELIVI